MTSRLQHCMFIRTYNLATLVFKKYRNNTDLGFVTFDKSNAKALSA